MYTLNIFFYNYGSWKRLTTNEIEGLTLSGRVNSIKGLTYAIAERAEVKTQDSLKS